MVGKRYKIQHDAPSTSKSKNTTGKNLRTGNGFEIMTVPGDDKTPTLYFSVYTGR